MRRCNTPSIYMLTICLPLLRYRNNIPRNHKYRGKYRGIPKPQSVVRIFVWYLVHEHFLGNVRYDNVKPREVPVVHNRRSR